MLNSDLMRGQLADAHVERDVVVRDRDAVLARIAGLKAAVREIADADPQQHDIVWAKARAQALLTAINRAS